MSAPHRLTIGIPTYNFGSFIGETLASIVPQLGPDDAILVLDGGSTDDTAEVMAEWCARVPAIRYVRQATRGGIDADMARVVELADAPYVWLFSADDIMLPGAIAVVRELLWTQCDVYLLVHADATLDLRIVHARHPIIAGPSGIFELGDFAQRQAYFAAARSSEALFSFMGGLVIRRERWDPTQPSDGFFYGSCWAHVARLLTAARNGKLRVGYHADPLLVRRGDNDSFLTGGVVKRFALAIEGYQRIVAALFGSHSVELTLTRRLLAREFGLLALLDCKARAAVDPVGEDRARLDRMVASIHRDGWRGHVVRAAYSLTPGRPLRRLIALKRALRRYRTAA